MVARGDVVLVEFPYVDGTHGKIRPALVIQCERNNVRLQNTVVAMITGNIRFATTEPTQVLVDPQTPEGNSSGLHGRSAVKCENIFTVSQRDILRTIGQLTPPLMLQVDAALRLSLGIE
jgi:mRNA interferase MazF